MQKLHLPAAQICTLERLGKQCISRLRLYHVEVLSPLRNCLLVLWCGGSLAAQSFSAPAGIRPAQHRPAGAILPGDGGMLLARVDVIGVGKSVGAIVCPVVLCSPSALSLTAASIWRRFLMQA